MTDRRRLIGPAALLLLLGGAPTPDAARLSAEALALLDPRSVARALCADPRARAPSMIGAAYAAASPLPATMPLLDGLGRQAFEATSSSDTARRLCGRSLCQQQQRQPRGGRDARAVTTEALTLAAPPIERALVEALHRRYAPGGRQGGVHADAFADAMAAVAARFPDSDFTAILAAEAMMNT